MKLELLGKSELQQIWQSEYDKTCAFSKEYPSSMSEDNFRNVGDRKRHFSSAYMDTVQVATATMQSRLTARQIYDWGEGPCPHGTQSQDTSSAVRRECDQCWKELAAE